MINMSNVKYFVMNDGTIIPCVPPQKGRRSIINKEEVKLLYQQGHSYDEIARKFNVSYSCIYTAINGRNKQKQRIIYDVDKIINLHSEGNNCASIAKKLGINYRIVARILINKHGTSAPINSHTFFKRSKSAE